MLSIKTDQLAKLGLVPEQRFVARVQEYLRRHHGEQHILMRDGSVPVHDMPSELLAQFVRMGIERARGHGLSWQSNIASYVVLMVLVHPRFDDDPSIRQAIDELTVPTDLDWQELWNKTSEDDWRRLISFRHRNESSAPLLADPLRAPGA